MWWAATCYPTSVVALQPQFFAAKSVDLMKSRRAALGWLGKAVAALAVVETTSPNRAVAEAGPDSFDIDAYLKTGGVAMPMGVSGQGGKMRPATGVVLR